MKPNLKSALTALSLAALIVMFAVRVLAPSLPPMVGRPDAFETRTFAMHNPGSLRLDNTDGMILIRTHKGDTINGSASIRAYRRGDTTEDSLKQVVANLVKVSEEPGQLVVLTEPTQRLADYDLLVWYEISVPEGTNLDINSNNGNVWIEPGTGNVRVLGRNSDIDIQNPTGTVAAESVNGRIRVVDAPQGGQIRTVNGNVYAEVQGGILNATTDNGVIQAHVLGPQLERANLTSQNGGVTLKLASDVSAAITAHASRGSIVSQFPIDIAKGAQQRRYLQGTIGDGRAQINLDTLNGNILIARSN